MTLQTVRRVLLRVLLPVLQCLGRMHLPFTRKLVMAGDFRVALASLKPGDVLITRTRGEVSNYAIPGFFTHAALYLGDEQVLEATGAGVHATDLIDFLLKKDFVAVLNPTFATPQEEERAVMVAMATEGKPYDYGFTPSEDSFYCAELIGWSYTQALAPKESPFKYRLTLGVPTITAQDFFNAQDKWKLKLLLGGKLPERVRDVRAEEVAKLQPC